MKKFLPLLFCLSIALLFSSCKKQEASASLATILSDMETSLSIADPTELDTADLTDLYGIAADDVAEQASFITTNGIFPDEVILIKATDTEALSRIQEKLENRLSEVLVQSKSYDAESYAVAQTCKVDTRGLYVSLFISAKHDAMTEIYNNYF